MKKTVAVILTTMLLASAAASCSTEPAHTTRTSSTSRPRETTTEASEATTSETTAELQFNFPSENASECLTTSEFAMTPEAADAYYRSFYDVECLPGIPVALLATTQRDDCTVYLIIENEGAMSYSGSYIYHITEVFDHNDGTAGSRVDEYLPFDVGFGDSELIYNLPETYDIDSDLLALYTENAPDGYATPFMHAATNSTCEVFIADGGDDTIAFVKADDSGNSEIILTYDYSPLL